MTGLQDPCHVRKSAVHCRLSASLERASRGPLSQVTSAARQAVLDSIQCIICQDVVQLPVSIICFSGCPGTHARANNTCLRGVLCQHCANDGLQLNRPASERFSEERGRVRCMICRHTAVDSRQLTPVRAYAVNHALMDVMDAVDIGATCRKCEEDFPSQMALQAHYQKHCRHAVVQCRFKGCPQVGLRPLIDVHQETCTVGRAMCQQCKERVDKDELVYHMVANCRMRVVVCVLCSHRARLPDMLLHLRLHQAQLQLQILQKGSVPAATAAISSRSRQVAVAFQAFSGLPGQQQQQRHAAGATSQAVAVTLQAGMMQAAQGTGSFPAATPGGGLLASGPCPYNNPLPTGVQGAVSAALANPVMPTARPITSEALPTVPATTAHGAAAAAAIAGWSVPSAHPNLQAGGAAVMAAAALAHANGSMGTVNGSILGSRAALPATTLGAPEVTLLPGSMLHANQHQMLHDMLQRLRRRQQQQQQQQQQESLVQAAPAAHGQPQSSSVTQPGGNQQAALLSVPLPSPLQQQQQHQHQPKVQDHVQQQLQHSSQVVTTNQAASIHGEWPEYQLLPAQRHRQIPAQMHPPPVHAAADAGTMRASLSGSAGADLAKVPPAVVDVAAPAFTTGVAASFERGTVQAGLAGIDRTSRSSDLTEASSSVATCLRKGAGWQQRVASVPTASEAGRSGRPSDGQVMREDSDSGSSADMLTGILDEYGAGLLQTLSDALVGPVGPSNAQALQSGAQDVPMLVTISPAMFRHRSSDFVGYTSDAQRAAGHQAQHAPRFPDINSSEDSDGDGGGSDAGLTPESERLERAWPPDLPAAQLQAQVQPQEGDGSSDADCEGQRGTFGREGDDTAAADLHRAQPRAAETAGLGNCLSPLEGLARHTRLTYHAASADRHQASTYLATGGLNGSQLGAGDGERVSCASDQQGTPSEGGSRRQHSGRSVRAISMQHRRLAALCSAAECIGVGGRSWGGSPHRSDAPQRRRAGSVDAPGPRRRRLSDSEAIHVSRQELAMATQAVAAMLLCPAADQAEEQV